MSEADSGLEDGNASDAPQADGGPVTGNAGDPDLTLDAALNAAFDDVEGADPARERAEDRQADDTAGDGRGGEDRSAATGPGRGGEGGAPSIRAPEHWPAERKAAFDALATPHAKRAILDMARDLEAGVTRKSQDLSEQAKFADAIRAEITDEDRQLLAAQGLDETGGIRQLLALNRYARKDPPGYVRHVMRALGVTADGLGLDGASKNPSGGSSSRTAPGHPQTRQEQYRLPELVDQRVNAILHERAVAEATSLFDTFKVETDGEGNARHPHAETVREMMGTLARHPRYASLPPTIDSYKTLYDVAVRAHPDTRDEVLGAEIAGRAAADEEARKRQADLDKARRARSPVRGVGTPPGMSRKADASLDDILQDVFSAHGA